MKKLFFLLLLSVPVFLVHVSWVYAQLQNSHFYKVDDSEISSDFKADGFWKTYIEGSFLSNRESRERLMKIKLYGKFELEFTPYIFGFFEPYLVVEEGEVQRRRFVRSESTIQMHQGYFEIRPIESLSLQLGAVNQTYLSAPLLMGDHAFLSALAAHSYIRDTYEVQTVVQGSMPSVINSFNRSNEIADTPYFASVFNYGEWILSDWQSFKGHVTGFYFTPLPAFMAYESKGYGNTVSGERAGARFIHSYYGMNFDLSSQTRLIPAVYFSMGYNALLNFGAPREKAWGERMYVGLDMDFWKFLKLYSQVEYFYNNSDSAPAYFNSEIYGHNNRKGFLVELKAFIPKGNFEVGFRYVLSNPIQKDFIDSSSLEEEDEQHSFMVFVSSRYLNI